MLPNSELKTCTKCRKSKSRHEFNKWSRSKDGLNSHCKTCRKQFNLDRKAPNWVPKYSTKHGKVGTKLYNRWSDMKTRCTNSNNFWFSRYGGRGITVCEEWLEFNPFCEWAENHGYSDELVLDRVDNDKGYYPDNCRWATNSQSMLNRGVAKNNTSGITGVSKHRCGWKARRDRKHLGYYDTREEAEKAVNAYMLTGEVVRKPRRRRRTNKELKEVTA